MKKLESDRDLKFISAMQVEDSEKMKSEEKHIENLNIGASGESALLYERIAFLETANKKLNEELEIKVKENKGLSQTIENLNEELGFIKNKTAAYIKDMNQNHQIEKENLMEKLRQLENRTKENSQKEQIEKERDINKIDETKLIEELKRKLEEQNKQIFHYKELYTSSQKIDPSLIEKYQKEFKGIRAELEKITHEKALLENEKLVLHQVKNN